MRRGWRRCEATWAWAVLAAMAIAGCEARQGGATRAPAEESYESLRRTAVVEVYQACKESVVNIGSARKDEKDPNITHTEFASGVVLHPAGFVLTNAHLLQQPGDLAVGFEGDGDLPARVIAVDEERDLAVLKIEADQRFKPIRFGRSRGLLVGERVITMGNPFGMGLTVAEGIVSALGRSTKSEYAFYADMIQTDATTNPGSSGGPLLNVSGEMVGINTTKNLKADNIAFAIPADRLREVLPDILAVEERYGFSLGLTVDGDGPACVTEVAKGSPAEAGGVRAGDIITHIGREDVASALDFHLALVGARGGEPISIGVLRDGQFRSLTVVPKTVEPRAAEQNVGALAAGLEWEACNGRWERLPDFSGVEVAKRGTAEQFGLAGFEGTDGFALRFTGYIDVPADGVYTFYTRSDDGSRLYIGDRLVVDNDGPHSAREARGFIVLAKGKHPITVAYFETIGGEVLEVSWEGPGLRKSPIPATAPSSAAP
ncbi:MAG: trypsin-like peptidase domain-containing protein [Phycisphaerae bacterium]